ncbi:hypothetical protein AKI39_04570 [Bordetella sp. H567]|uniref:hypothetical protein n=1 Tax=Bordetella sp. H567 TaxID=1697043 RepID=UPI00081D0886|nr:hypothetical protein [Bordetella sp. H567]AOB30120.1 hypothetical protein AKI39_04570 [Bordetella sp. H567]
MLISYIDVDKFVATPIATNLSNPEFPASDGQYYAVTVQVYDDQGNKAKGPTDVYLGDDQQKNRVQYWSEDKVNITATVLAGTAVSTDKTGLLMIYVTINNFSMDIYPGCIFNLFASPTPDPLDEGINQTLTCCYSTFQEAMAHADPDLGPMVLPQTEDQVVIPHWNDQPQKYYFTYTMSSLSPSVSQNATMHIIINGKRVDRLDYSYGNLLSGVKLPYHLMEQGPGRNNCILYFTDEGNGNAKASMPWAFAVSGVPLLMPNPDTEGSLVKPSWWGAKKYGDPPPNQPLTLADLADSNDVAGFDVELKIDPAANIGDVYRIYLYQNGYKDDKPHTLLLGDGGPIPGVPQAPNVLTFTVDTIHWPAGSTVTIAAPKEWSEGFAYRDSANPGYLWVDYQVNGRERSGIYPSFTQPILINFAATDTTKQEVEGRVSDDTGNEADGTS